MDNQELFFWIMMLSSVLIGALSAWLVKRADNTKRFWWFIGSIILMILAVGLKLFLLPLAICITILFFMKQEHDNPTLDVYQGFIAAIFGGLSWLLFGLYFLMPLGFLYWQFIALQEGSFWMFVVGFIPISWPIGAYALVFEMPEWVLDIFT